MDYRVNCKNQNERGVVIIVALVAVVVVAVVATLIYSNLRGAHNMTRIWQRADKSQHLADSAFDHLRHTLDNYLYSYYLEHNSFHWLDNYQRNGDSVQIKHGLYEFYYDGIPVVYSQFPFSLESGEKAPQMWRDARFSIKVDRPVKDKLTGAYSIWISAEAWFEDSRGGDLPGSRRYTTGLLVFDQSWIMDACIVRNKHSVFDRAEYQARLGIPDSSFIESTNTFVMNGDLYTQHKDGSALSYDESQKVKSSMLWESYKEYSKRNTGASSSNGGKSLGFKATRPFYGQLSP